MAEIKVFLTNTSDTPLTGVLTADLAQVQIRRTDTQAIVLAFGVGARLTEIGDGNFTRVFALPDFAVNYTWTVDADPNSSGNVQTPLFISGEISGPAEAALLTDVPAILADTAAMEPLVTGFLDAAISTRAVPGDAMALTPAERVLVAAAVRDVSLTGSTIGTLGGAALIAQGARTAWRLDGGSGVAAIVRNGQGFITSARLRIFASLADATAANAGGIGPEGALITSTVSGVASTFPTLPDNVLVGT